jgi:hypothetical protein
MTAVGRRVKTWLVGSCAVLGALAAPATPPAVASVPPGAFAQINTVLSGTTISLRDEGGLEILDRVAIGGRIPIPGPDQSVTITVRREGRVMLRRRVRTDPVSGRFRMPLKLRGCCAYVAQAAHGTDLSVPFGFEVRPPRRLTGGVQTELFNRLLRENGYHMGSVTDRVDESTGLGILALRKVIGLPWSESYSPELYSELLRGRARFAPRYDDEGRHVEVDLERQVMALVEDGRATDVFHISSGAGGNPTGEFSFYSRGPGYNAKGMYYSVYYDGNYATHGYYSVPTYPASHGCIRNSIPYAVFVYNWISLGDSMYVYY